MLGSLGSVSRSSNIGSRGAKKESVEVTADSAFGQIKKLASQFSQLNTVTKEIVSKKLDSCLPKAKADARSFIYDLQDILEAQMNDEIVSNEMYKFLHEVIMESSDHVEKGTVGGAGVNDSVSNTSALADQYMRPEMEDVSGDEPVFSQIGASTSAEEPVYVNMGSLKELRAQGNKLLTQEKHLNDIIDKFKTDLAPYLSENPKDESTQVFKLFKQTRSTSADNLDNFKASREQVNAPKNRWKNILPFDATRVKLNNTRGGSDYINANVVGSSAPFIASQAPLAHTVADHWQMIWEQDVPFVEVLAQEVEGGKSKMSHYWPSTTGVEETHGNFTIKCQEAVDMDGGATISTLKVTDNTTKEEKFVVIGQYKRWPDFGVIQPKDLPVFHQFQKTLRAESEKCRSLNQPRLLPNSPRGKGLPLKHCSAGVGRTGAVGLAENLTQSLKTRKLSEWQGSKTVEAALRTYRKQRSNNFVQTASQLQLAMNMTLFNLESALKDVVEERQSIAKKIVSQVKLG